MRVLSLLRCGRASGRANGVVVDLGHAGAVAAPVVGGRLPGHLDGRGGTAAMGGGAAAAGGGAAAPGECGLASAAVSGATLSQRLAEAMGPPAVSAEALEEVRGTGQHLSATQMLEEARGTGQRRSATHMPEEARGTGQRRSATHMLEEVRITRQRARHNNSYARGGGGVACSIVLVTMTNWKRETNILQLVESTGSALQAPQRGRAP